jgi:general secretion pathway protein H
MTPARLHRCTQLARAPRVRGQAGVTLLELLVVLSIMAIVAAVAGPYLAGGVSGPELKGAARQVAAGLRLARSEALSTRREARLVVDLERHTFRVDGDAREHALPKDAGLKLFTAQNDLVSDRVGAIRFYPDGGSNGGRITIAAGERKYEVDVDWLTGRVAILD